MVALSGRDDAATDGLVGCVTNPVVLRVRTHGAPTGEELTARVRRSLLAAHAHQDHPYERVLEHLDRDRADRGRGLFTVACSYLRTEPPHPEDTDWPGGLRVTPRVLAPTHTDQDLLLQLRDHRTPEGAPSGLTGELIHSLAHCTPSTAQRLADTLRTKLRELAAWPGGGEHAVPLARSGTDVPDGRSSAAWTEAGEFLSRGRRRVAAGAMPRQNGIRPRVRRPAEPLRPTALELLRNGLLKIRPRTPGALPPAREPAPRVRWVPRSGWRERRGTRKASTARTTQTATIPTTIMTSSSLLGGRPRRVPRVGDPNHRFYWTPARLSSGWWEQRKPP